MREPIFSVLLSTKVGCVCGWGQDCLCLSDERVLRGYAYTKMELPVMTAEQREWCVREVQDCEEGTTEDFTKYDDRELARAVLLGWQHYVNNQM